MKNRNKYILLAAILIAALLILICALQSSDIEDQPQYTESPLRITSQSSNMLTVRYTLVDEATGVNYIAFSREDSVAICPRYNPDGSFYVD